jgi:hypothetical protein
MNPWDIIAEAKIRDWQRRKEAGEVSEEEPDVGLEAGEGKSIERQLFEEARSARKAARDTEDPAEREALLERSNKARIRMMVMLEKNGFPLLARQLQQRLDSEEADDE